MRKPRIGIPLTLDNRERWRADREYHYIDRSYADAVDRAGGLPLHLPIQTDPAEVMTTLDGLLLPGGDDFPSEAPLAPEIELDLVPEEQLAFDEALFAAARAREIPVLGICYGMQLMVRAGGGQLDAHLPSQRPGTLEHRLPAQERHAVELAPDSQLARVLGSSTLEVNSLHHQGVRQLGPGQRAVGHAPDGVIEAVESFGATEAAGAAGGEGGPWCIAVQWHPEKMSEDSSARLFSAFIDACRDAAPRAGSGARP
ncbi:MAG: gamma-glutamyl-gamma-aminobutyrate hydrolase family protein [Myxococcota bacterium]